MSCLNLKLSPAKKTWKSFTSKLKIKLCKSNSKKSKVIKKPRSRRLPFAYTCAKALKPGLRRNKRSLSKNKYFKKKTAPVYIDMLFKEPVIEFVEQIQVPISENRVKVVHPPKLPSAGDTKIEGEEPCNTAGDDMWESLALTSPQMYRIDQRAEEFITRFRAEMQLQEMMATCLQ
ncbi:uncharacterized protein LOC110807681 [Carica papaya]|uniref:uncharacterized protein LOC110807681 n=1 Tax=Carica papaya TaxID=3649 RepID=UPI000B8C84CC|nr:uncharacterized protein LOC110807681 [Carica papaya]